ncbi:hypothetical protein ACFSKN_13880 [Mariniflexile gromovii]|uniref:Uncharacterized protein n=1 Tax=Mariniflexile gromovii TaxID=362523 RepID=A0ABS4BRN3_9FLAO|nr:hypothetical protein [Mariniflexile gromovii]MBP0903058.1 hypothetical protein [Mariniflexile gromovii]
MIHKFDILNDETIKNIKGFINDPHFTTKSVLTYERHYFKGSIKVIEYYSNHELNSYFETETTEFFIIERGYSNEDKLFSTNVIYLNQTGQPYMEYTEVLDIDKTLNKCYRKINSKKEYSFEGFDTFSDALKYKSHIL